MRSSLLQAKPDKPFFRHVANSPFPLSFPTHFCLHLVQFNLYFLKYKGPSTGLYTLKTYANWSDVGGEW